MHIVKNWLVDNGWLDNTIRVPLIMGIWGGKGQGGPNLRAPSCALQAIPSSLSCSFAVSLVGCGDISAREQLSACREVLPDRADLQEAWVRATVCWKASTTAALLF